MNTPGKLPYYLIENRLANKNETCYARSIVEQTIETEQIIQKMVQRNTTVSRPDIIAVLELLEDTISQELYSGAVVDLGFITLRCNIKGNFESWDDTYDKKRHKVHMAAKIDKEFERKICSRIKPVKTSYSPGYPKVISVTYYTTGKKNSTLTPGGIIEIKGRSLVLDWDNPECGVFVVPTISPEKRTIELKQTEVLRATERTLIVRVPLPLPAGICRIKIKKQYFDNKQEIIFNKELEVMQER